MSRYRRCDSEDCTDCDERSGTGLAHGRGDTGEGDDRCENRRERGETVPLTEIEDAIRTRYPISPLFALLPAYPTRRAGRVRHPFRPTPSRLFTVFSPASRHPVKLSRHDGNSRNADIDGGRLRSPCSCRIINCICVYGTGRRHSVSSAR